MPSIEIRAPKRAALLIAPLVLAGLSTFATLPAPVAAATATATLRPTADARVDSSTPTRNYGTASYVGVDAQPYVHSYLRFVASGVAGTITRATLRLYTLNAQDSGFYLYRVADNSWGETSVTWNNAPAFGSQLGWSGNGVTANRWYSLDVTSYVNRNGTYSFGLSALSWARLDMSSREGAYPPQLIIETTVTPTPTATRTPTPTIAPAPTATVKPTATPVSTPTATPGQLPAPASLRWGLIGNDGTHLATERSAGITTKLLELAWRSYEPSNGSFSASYVTAKKSELAALRSAGFDVILSLGVQYAPSWLLSYPNAYYVDQIGQSYNDTCSGCEIPNFVFNATLRSLQDRYIGRVFADFGASSFAAVRLGGGHYGELGYPAKSYGSNSNTYWGFDANAQASSPVPGWKPGMASPNGEASKFLSWYLDRLVDYETWQIATARRYYAGPLMMLFPSFGIRPGQANAAIAVNLNGTTSAEVNGEVQRGYDYARQVAAIKDANVWVDSTWLDCPYGNDASTNPVDWRPIHYLTYLAAQNPLHLRAYGENTGQGSASVMTFTQAQAKTYRLVGFVWFNESQLFSGQYATLSAYAALIAGNP